jgi:LysM repeat protein
MSRRALIGFIFLNIVVSLGMVFLALTLWSKLVDENEADPQSQVPDTRQLVVTATQRPGELPSSALLGTISALESELSGIASNPRTPDGSGIVPTRPNDDDKLPTFAPSSMPAGVPTLNPTIIAQVTLPFGDNNATDDGSDTGDDGDDLSVPDGCERYTVQSGDTCIALADRFEVDLNGLIVLNQLDANCATLRLDQVILIPSESCAPPPTSTTAPTVTNTPFAIGTFSITNTPQSTATNASVQIRQVQNFGDVTLEQVDIQNTGGEVVNLLNWSLRDADGNVFTFPDLLMQPGQIVKVFTRTGSNTPAALFWNRNTPMWTLGESAILQNGDGEPQSTFTVGGQSIEAQ